MSCPGRGSDAGVTKAEQDMAAGARAEDGAAGIHVLPDEILVLVFSQVRDGEVLLDDVALVCKRWRRVARDPRSWAGVELTLGLRNNKDRRAGDEEYAWAKEARVLLHAPAAKSLEVAAAALRRAVCTYPTGPSYVRGLPTLRRVCASALRRSRTVVTDSVRILETGWRLVREPAEAEAGAKAEAKAAPRPCAIACFLVRQRGLRELRLYLTKGDKSAILAAVAQQRRLHTLQLVVAAGARYRGELAAGLPELRELRYHARSPRDHFVPQPPRGVVGDLVRGARALRVLRVDMPCGADREACAALRTLEHIELNVYQDAAGFRPVGLAAERALRQAWRLCLQVHSPALRSAVVTVCRGEHARYSRKRVAASSRLMRQEFSPKMPLVELETLMNGPGRPGEMCEECDDSTDLAEFDAASQGWWCPGNGWPESDSDEPSDEDSEDDDDDEPQDGDSDAESDGEESDDDMDMYKGAIKMRDAILKDVFQLK